MFVLFCLCLEWGSFALSTDGMIAHPASVLIALREEGVVVQNFVALALAGKPV
jgi:hypothetical protein